MRRHFDRLRKQQRKKTFPAALAVVLTSAWAEKLRKTRMTCTNSWKNVLSVRHAFHVCFICSLSVTLAVTCPVLVSNCAAIVLSLCVLSVHSKMPTVRNARSLVTSRELPSGLQIWGKRPAECIVLSGYNEGWHRRCVRRERQSNSRTRRPWYAIRTFDMSNNGQPP